jgi:hypothetical protein
LAAHPNIIGLKDSGGDVSTSLYCWPPFLSFTVLGVFAKLCEKRLPDSL